MNYWDKRYKDTLTNGATGMMKAKGNDLADESIFNIIKYMIEGTDYKSALDFGCGLGNKIPLLESIGIKKIYGYDISSVALKQAEKRYPKYGFSDNLNAIENVDLIYCHFVLQHIMDDVDLFEVLNRLRLIGKELIVVDNISDKLRLPYMVFRSESRHDNFFEVSGWQEKASAITKIGDEYVKIWRLE